MLQQSGNESLKLRLARRALFQIDYITVVQRCVFGQRVAVANYSNAFGGIESCKGGAVDNILNSRVVVY